MVRMKKGNFVRYRYSKSSHRQDGIALIIALICLFVVSTLAVGVMFSTQSEIWTSANYRATAQARYLAEAGAQQALNYLNQFTTPADFTTAYNLNNMPVTHGTATTGPVVIMATSGYANTQYQDTYSGYEATQDAAFQTYFANSIAQTPFGTLVSASGCTGSSCPRFDVALQLLTAVQSSNGWLMRWKIVSQGTLNTVGSSATAVSGSSAKARVQVVEVVDSVISYTSGGSGNPSPTYAAGVFATSSGCGAITMSGGQYTNSYNSTAQPGNTSPSYANTGGDVATNGNVTITNGAYIVGNVFTPFYNLGATGTYGISGGPIWPGLNAPVLGPYSYGSPTTCSTATGGTEWAVYEDNSGSSVGCTGQSSSGCSQKTYNLPSPAPSYPTPVMPTVAANTAACSGYNGICSGGSGGGSGCTVTIPPSTLPSGSAGTGAANFGTVTLAACAIVNLQAGTYNMDSLNVTSGAHVVLPTTGAVVINILDNGTATNPLSVSGGIVANNGGSPANLTFIYGGTKPLILSAGANMFATVYAPNSPVTMSGNAGLFGALVAKTATFQGSGHVIYDTNLANQHWNVPTGTPPTPTVSPLHVDEFSWSAF